jgi:hypothetical protein
MTPRPITQTTWFHGDHPRLLREPIPGEPTHLVDFTVHCKRTGI